MATSDDTTAPRLTVGSLIGVPLGATPAATAPLAPARNVGGQTAVEEIEGPGWTVRAGEVGRGGQSAWRGDGVEALTYDNPFGQVMERVWFDGKIVFAVDLGRVTVDPAQVKVAQEYQIVFSVDLDERGRSVTEPELVPGQFNIYDTVPGMDRYSPIWQFNYFVVPRDYTPNTLRSEADCLNSGYRIVKSQDFEN
jgi:hypothetical protein